MDIKTDDFGRTTGLNWVFDGRDPNVPREVTIRFSPEDATERLSGLPGTLFNSPAPGADLVARVPVPPIDKETAMTLEINSSNGRGPILVPIKIQRPA